MKPNNSMQAALQKAGLIGDRELERAHRHEELKRERATLYARINSIEFMMATSPSQDSKRAYRELITEAQDRIAEIGREIGKGYV